jgi:DNA recombination protein RmuC
MNPEILIALTLSAALFGVVGYLLAVNRASSESAARATAQKVAEEQSREARKQAEELRAERDRAGEKAESLEKANSALAAERHGLGEQIGRLRAELEATSAYLRRKEADAERLRSALSTGEKKSEEAKSRLRESEQQISGLRALETQLRVELQELKQQLAELVTEKQALNQKAAALEAVRKELDQTRDENNRLQEETINTMMAKVVKLSQEQLLATAETALAAVGKPVQERLTEMDGRLREFSNSRASADAKLTQQIVSLAEESVRNRNETSNLVQALKQPQVRGSWGEMQLKRAAEISGMLQHCDFDLQVHFPDVDESQRPDMLVHLAGDKHVVIDAKVSMVAFLKAIEADESQAEAHWNDHAKQLRKHVDGLAAKAYFRNTNSPEFVVMYLPSDAFLVPALQYIPTLLEEAAAKRVLIVTPTSFIGMLRTIGYAWTQAALQDNLKQVYELGRELYTRLARMGGHLDKLGAALDRSVKAYNDTIGSIEGRVLVTARKFNDLKVVEEPMLPLKPATESRRRLSRPELLESAAADQTIRLIPEEDELGREGTNG